MALTFKKTKGVVPDKITGKKTDIFVGEDGTSLYRVYQPFLANPDKEWVAERTALGNVGSFQAWLLAARKDGFKNAEEAKAYCKKMSK